VPDDTCRLCLRVVIVLATAYREDILYRLRCQRATRFISPSDVGTRLIQRRWRAAESGDYVCRRRRRYINQFIMAPGAYVSQHQGTVC